MPSPRTARPLPLIVAALAALSGCRPADEIRTYQVKKSPESPAAPTPEPTADGPAKVRLLGAVIPVGEQSFFVKFTGPVEAIDPHEKEFDAFLDSIRVTDDPRKPPTYTAPPGWKELPQRQMRLVTFAVGGGAKPPEAYISTPFGGSLLDNVNRWREEVGLKRITAAELPTATKELTLGPTKAHRIDARGPGGKGGGMMRPPFAGQ